MSCPRSVAQSRPGRHSKQITSNTFRQRGCTTRQRVSPPMAGDRPRTSPALPRTSGTFPRKPGNGCRTALNIARLTVMAVEGCIIRLLAKQRQFHSILTLFPPGPRGGEQLSIQEVRRLRRLGTGRRRLVAPAGGARRLSRLRRCGLCRSGRWAFAVHR